MWCAVLLARKWMEATHAWQQAVDLATPMFGASHERTIEHQMRLKRVRRPCQRPR